MLGNGSIDAILWREGQARPRIAAHEGRRATRLSRVPRAICAYRGGRAGTLLARRMPRLSTTVAGGAAGAQCSLGGRWATRTPNAITPAAASLYASTCAAHACDETKFTPIAQAAGRRAKHGGLIRSGAYRNRPGGNTKSTRHVAKLYLPCRRCL